MPPKTRITAELILEAALDRIRRDGYESLNARSLAEDLKCSTMPLFRYFKSMEEIREGAVQRGIEIYNRYMQEGLSESVPFKGMGRAYIRFAQEEPNLFRIFFMQPTKNVPGVPEIDPNTALAVHAAEQSTGRERNESEQILREMWIFVHGIAVLAVTQKTVLSEEEISQMTFRVFAALNAYERKEGGQ